MPQFFFDGNYAVAQYSEPPKFIIPFAKDPKLLGYTQGFWQKGSTYNEIPIGTVGPFGGYYVGLVPGSFKVIAGGVIEFHREFSLVPDTRSEFESFVYSYQIVLIGENGGITEMPISVKSRLQFDYFRTDDPDSINLPKAPRAFQVQNVIYLLNDFCNIFINTPTGAEVLAEDATFKIWKPGIYERQQRFIPWISLNDLFANAGCQ